LRNKNKQGLLRGKRLNYNAGIQVWYNNSLQKLIRKMTAETKKELTKLFKRIPVKSFATDESISSQARILMNELTKTFASLFALESQTLPKYMLERTVKASSAGVQSSLQELAKGITIKTSTVTPELTDAVTASIAENVSLIKSIPAQYFKDVTGAVMRSITSGQGMYDLLPEIEKYAKTTARRAELLALDQTRKAYTTVSVVKLNKAGVTKFQWLHSGGGREPRESHLKIDGDIFTFANVEEEQAKLGVPKQDRGLPGYPVNCRCVLLAVEEYEE
jgi:SPP1 gp7 family putative phage head morphogenesis protein